MGKAINEFFNQRIKHWRTNKYGEHSKIRTTIREGPMKLAQYWRRKEKL